MQGEGKETSMNANGDESCSASIFCEEEHFHPLLDHIIYLVDTRNKK